jgi:hypothetical protein
MIRGISYSKGLAAAAAAALIAAGATLWMRVATKASLLDLRQRAVNAERDLRDRINAMSPYEDEDVIRLRRQVDQFRTHLGSDGTWEGLVRRLGAGWSAEVGSREDRGGYSVQLGTLTLQSHAVTEWPGIVDMTGQLEAMPGVGIAELEMKTSGSGDRRSLDTARIVVVIQTNQALLN